MVGGTPGKVLKAFQGRGRRGHAYSKAEREVVVVRRSGVWRACSGERIIQRGRSQEKSKFSFFPVLVVAGVRLLFFYVALERWNRTTHGISRATVFKTALKALQVHSSLVFGFRFNESRRVIVATFLDNPGVAK